MQTWVCLSLKAMFLPHDQVRPIYVSNLLPTPMNCLSFGAPHPIVFHCQALIRLISKRISIT